LQLYYTTGDAFPANAKQISDSLLRGVNRVVKRCIDRVQNPAAEPLFHGVMLVTCGELGRPSEEHLDIKRHAPAKIFAALELFF
jgi:hypothetical protein